MDSGWLRLARGGFGAKAPPRAARQAQTQLRVFKWVVEEDCGVAPKNLRLSTKDKGQTNSSGYLAQLRVFATGGSLRLEDH